MTHRVITASRLDDGAVIWLDRAGDWVEEFDQASASDDGTVIGGLLARALADEKTGRVISPYEVEIAAPPEAPVPVRLRERIRAFGPTKGLQGSA